MKLWVLGLKHYRYDYLLNVVVRAETEAAARELVASSDDAGDEPSEWWISPAHSTCSELHADGVPGVIVADIFEA